MPVFSRIGRSLLIVILVTFGLSACDSGPGTTSAELDPPIVSDFSFDPQEVGTGLGEEEVVSFPLSMRAAVDPRGNVLDEVAFLVRAPEAGAEPVLEGQLEQADGAYYETTVDVSIPRGEIGLYTVIVYAVGAEGTLSNEVRGNLRIIGEGQPPVIEEVAAPDTLQRPASGADPVLLPLVVTVSDPDGLTNLNRVQFWNAASPATRFDMFDDGENGDETAGDGRYTRIVEISSTNQPGTTRLLFQATDRAGLTSEVAEHEVVVVE